MPSCRQEDGDLLLACLSGKMAGQSGGRMKTKIDATDVRIVEELRKNARITMKELGARVFLTGQAVRNRVERLEDMGILQRYTINVNCPVFGYKVHAVIRVQLRHDPVEALKACCRKGGRRTIHCYRTTGDNLYFLDMYFLDMEALDAFLAEVEPLGSYELHVVLREAEDLAE